MDKKVRLKSFKELEKKGYVYHNEGGRLVLTNGKGVYKVFNQVMVQEEFTVVDTSNKITQDEYKALKDLFEDVE